MQIHIYLYIYIYSYKALEKLVTIILSLTWVDKSQRIRETHTP